jgi:hypothetical protein
MSSPRSPRVWLDVASLATLIALALFLVAMGVAIGRYPGGSWTVPTDRGFSLVRNFWCDLLRSQAINGADNASSKLLASLAFAALGAGLWPYWWVAASTLEGAGRRRVSRLGTASAASLAAMAVLPSDRFPIAHGGVALAGALLGMCAAGVSLVARTPHEPPLGVRRVAGVLLLACVAGNAALYIDVAYLGGPETVAQPIVQKLATVALVIWMSSTVRQARQCR